MHPRRLAIGPSSRWRTEGGGCPRRPRLPWGRPHSTLRRCAGSRPGSGWDRVGPARSRPRAPPTPSTPGVGTLVFCTTRRPGVTPSGAPHGNRPAPGGSPTRPASPHQCRAPLAPARGDGDRPRPGEVKPPPAGAGRSAAAQRHRMGSWAGGPPSTIRTARLQSVARGPPAAYQPGHLPGVLPRKSGDARLGEGFPLRCFQRFARPHVATQRCRSRDNWCTSGASTPVLSY